MRSLFIAMLLTLLSAAACKKSSGNAQANATFYYSDIVPYCMCCSGWSVQIDGESKQRTVYQIPDNTNLPKAPERQSMRVAIKWQPTKSDCIKTKTNAIDITELKKFP